MQIIRVQVVNLNSLNHSILMTLFVVIDVNVL